MLASLYISNYALIDELDIEFGEGLNIITGETGAGKSIVLGALGLLLGERADAKTQQAAERKTIVEARFTVEENNPINDLLALNNIDVLTEECILRREITVRGTSRAFINDTPVNLTVLKTVSERLLDIHTQHENLLLCDTSFQLQILDALADNKTLLEQYREEFSAYKKAVKEFTVFRDNLKRVKAESDYNSYLLSQLDELNLQPGEQEQLETERDIIANATEIKAHLVSALNNISRDDNNALTYLSASIDALEKLNGFIEGTRDLSERLESARIEIADIADTLEEYESNVAASGTDLEAIEQRLGVIYALQARHNVKTDSELIEIHKKLKRSIADSENGDEILSSLETVARNAKKKVVNTARALSAARTEIAKSFSNLLKERALPLGMNNLRCDIRVTQDKLMESGIDNVEFLFAFNKNQPLMPVSKTASGGEIARVILAIKSILVDKMQLPTIIFDEVDTGVSGEVANKMAELMLQISRKTQVITITHIATVAAHGKMHFKVFKTDMVDSTHTHVRLLDTEERVHELAAMISGNADDTDSLHIARNLLNR